MMTVSPGLEQFTTFWGLIELARWDDCAIGGRRADCLLAQGHINFNLRELMNCLLAQGAHWHDREDVLFPC
jgi:hypothetical protein